LADTKDGSDGFLGTRGIVPSSTSSEVPIYFFV